MTVFKNIANGLVKHLSAMTAIPEMALENVAYEPKIGTAFIKARTQPAETTQTSLGVTGLNTQSGLFILDYYLPKGQGRGTQDTFVDELETTFKRGTVITHNSVDIRIDKVYPIESLEEDDWYHVPYYIGYTAYTDN